MDENSLLETLQRNKEPILSYLSTFLTVGKKRLSMPVSYMIRKPHPSDLAIISPQVKSSRNSVVLATLVNLGWGGEGVQFYFSRPRQFDRSRGIRGTDFSLFPFPATFTLSLTAKYLIPL